MEQTDKVFYPRLQELIETHECYVCFDEHGFFILERPLQLYAGNEVNQSRDVEDHETLP
jgi:hypothetical protein